MLRLYFIVRCLKNETATCQVLFRVKSNPCNLEEICSNLKKIWSSIFFFPFLIGNRREYIKSLGKGTKQTDMIIYAIIPSIQSPRKISSWLDATQSESAKNVFNMEVKIVAKTYGYRLHKWTCDW